MKTLDDLILGRNGLWFALEEVIKAFQLGDFLVGYESDGHGCTKVILKYLRITVAKERFQQRAKELGFVGKYRWGVEYPSNGKKPDLADDVVVQAKINDVWCSGEDCVAMWTWRFVQSFRTTDQRHKPADTSYLHKPTYTPIKSADDCLVEHAIKTGQERYNKELSVMILEEVAKHGSISASLMPDSNTFEFTAQGDSDWWDYNNQEMKTLPDNNTDVELLVGGAYQTRAEYIGIRGFKVVFYRYDTHEIDHAELPTASFRPLDWNRKAEAEKKRVVDAAIEAMKPNPLTGTMEKWFGKLYDLGYLRLPTEKN